MIKLDENWMTIGVLDLERKQYELLAYLQKVERKFDKLELYPYYTDLIKHYRNLTTIRDNKQIFKNGFPKELVDISLEGFTLKYEDLVIDSGWLKEIDYLVEFAIQEFKDKIIIGKFIYDEVERCTDLIEIGPVHFNNDKGYFILTNEDIDVYEFEIVRMLDGLETKGLKTRLVRSYPSEFLLSYESIRLDLVDGSQIENPSTFIIDCPIKYPVEETLLPISKKILLKKFFQPHIS